MTLRVDLTSTSSHLPVVDCWSSGSGHVPTVGHRRVVVVPFTVSRGQAYYWSSMWQRDEQESVREIKAGEMHTFDSGRDAISWLLTEDDD